MKRFSERREPPDLGRGIFVCSKPLQFLMCAAIVRKYAIQDPTIYVVASGIKDADAFFEFLRSSEYNRLFRNIQPCTDHREALLAMGHLSYDSLFLEDDRVSFYRLFAPAKTRYMAVFEEGIGTYRGDYRAKLTGLRKVKWFALSVATGCGLQFGDGRKTDFVLVQHPEAYSALNPRNAKKALAIPGFFEELENNREAWQRVIDAAGILRPRRDERVALVLGTWGGAPPEKIAEIIATHDVVYYKAHPHDGVVEYAESLRVIHGSWVPAEVYVDYLASSCRQLCVYHFSSSTFMNCLGKYEDVQFVDLCEDPRFIEVRNALHRHARGPSRHA